MRNLISLLYNVEMINTVLLYVYVSYHVLFKIILCKKDSLENYNWNAKFDLGKYIFITMNVCMV